MKLIPCDRKEATHVRIIDEHDCELAGVTYGGIYEYKFDDSPDEQCHYIEADNGDLLYDFEVYLACEYYKAVESEVKTK